VLKGSKTSLGTANFVGDAISYGELRNLWEAYALLRFGCKLPS
jgi:hypothetical protein